MINWLEKLSSDLLGVQDGLEHAGALLHLLFDLLPLREDALEHGGEDAHAALVEVVRLPRADLHLQQLRVAGVRELGDEGGPALRDR